MPFIDDCDLFGSFNEEGINCIGAHVMKQRPSLFNYGKQLFAAYPELLCQPIQAHPEVTRRGNPLITVEDLLPILGSDVAFGLGYCAQVTKLEVGLYAGNRFALPPELSPLPAQRFALRVQVCSGIACPDEPVAERSGEIIAE